MHNHIIGFGDIGQRVAKLELARGHQVSTILRNKARIDAVNNSGIDVTYADLDLPDTLHRQLPQQTRVFYFAPPPATGTADSCMENWLNSIKNITPAKIIYISTTGIYGDCQGQWVDEQHPPNPTTDRAKRRLSAENQLAKWGQIRTVPIIRLRVPGIYHPSTLPIISLQRGRPILRSEDAPYSNRIHADDLAQICLAAADHGVAGNVYNVADNDTSSMSNYFIKIAYAFGLPKPLEISWEEAKLELSPTMISYLQESRRISNRKMISQLGVKLLYPTLDDGLRCLGKSATAQPPAFL
ncbi:Nucleoside-diphosphate-sugar epimerases [hydrothermal vent metagenome]|uniref:Nucleoside-diphosphate-sugar epimerases n=1 Tax=hydrothermal vent metagenome TaxID=652676 RepID=A0A3B1AYV3_9ZZZZ